MSNNIDVQNLIVGDRINFPYILANSILKFHDSIVRIEGTQSVQEVREAALVIFNSLPDPWILRDKQLRLDLGRVTIAIKVDKRKECCGVKVGKPQIEEIEELQPYRLYNACINVLQRRGMLSKIVYSENQVPTPESLEEDELDETPPTDSEQEDLTNWKDKVNEAKI